MDALEGRNAWKHTFDCSEYNPRLIQERQEELENARISCDVRRILFLIRTSLSRDLGGISNASLYRHSHIGTKDLVDRYTTTAVDTISAFVDLAVQGQCDEVELKYILDQLLATRQAFGRSALLFSGGATFGMYHIGVLKVLWQANLLPRVISGASAGSIICAVFCTRTDDELPALLESYTHGDFAVFDEQGREENIWQKTARFLKYGSFLDISHLARVMRCWLGDITFQEAYNRTRRVLNICVSSAGVYELPRILNYITAPNVLIWSAVAVSCSVPVVFTPFVLMAKDPVTERPVPWNDLHRQYIDGSVDGDLPMNRLSEMFNVNHFIVSQVNPHVIPFVSENEGLYEEKTDASRSSPGWLQSMTHLAKEEALHRMTVLSDLGIFSTSMTKLASIMNQKYSGDITIYPEIQFSSVPRMLKNPTTEFMVQACASGERATWPKLSRLRNHVAIELALDAAVQKIRAKVALNDSHMDSRLLSGASQRLGSNDSTNSRSEGRKGHQRRKSHNPEFEPIKRARRSSTHQMTAGIRRSRSVLDFETLTLSPPRRAPDWSVPSSGPTADYYDDDEVSVRDNLVALDDPEDGAPGYASARKARLPCPRRASWGPSSRQSAVPVFTHSRSRRFSSGSPSRQLVHSSDNPPSQGSSWGKSYQLYNMSMSSKRAND